jgi:hypothetical protein
MNQDCECQMNSSNSCFHWEQSSSPPVLDPRWERDMQNAASEQSRKEHASSSCKKNLLINGICVMNSSPMPTINQLRCTDSLQKNSCLPYKSRKHPISSYSGQTLYHIWNTSKKFPTHRENTRKSSATCKSQKDKNRTYKNQAQVSKTFELGQIMAHHQLQLATGPNMCMKPKFNGPYTIMSFNKDGVSARIENLDK